ncbi:hypothetical protein IOK49_04740 [Fervidicoccus fontis]|uniref:Uncharacterized protein n=1 Tax=Fervidicoccus fontis TaxID=683846 RepID=A0A843AIU4_9CREN|nr:hypothetical protein [Fervidicoccus fontis]MBE9391380.1 hypothetical protein [Fervidicoccus fontis]
MPEYSKMNAIQSIEKEYSEYLSVFLLLVFGGMIGMPSPPSSVTIRILPMALDELKFLQNKGRRVDDTLGDIIDAINFED